MKPFPTFLLTMSHHQTPRGEVSSVRASKSGVSKLQPQATLGQLPVFEKPSLAGLQPHPFVHVLHMASLPHNDRVEELRQRLYGPQSLKYLLSCPL